MIIDIITIFPEMFAPVLGESIIKRAQAKGLVKINVHDLREYSDDAHKKVDGPCYGGGAGMLFSAQPVFSAVEAVLGYSVYPKEKKDPSSRVVLMSPQGNALDQKTAKRFLGYQRIVLLAPRYEGVDERVRTHVAQEEISIGDYILSGGELAAMVFVDCIARLIPGVVSDKESIQRESFEQGLLDFPHYTRPEDFRGLKVPKVLLSGNHKLIDEWRKQQALKITKKKRPDLLK